MNRRSNKQSAAAHACFSAFARHFPGTTAEEWKAALLVLFPVFLAEAEGRPLPAPTMRESTREMDAERCGNLIEMCMWLGAELGVQFRNDD